MSQFFLSTAAFILLLILASGVTYIARLWKIPSTVALVTLGMVLAFAAKHGFLPFVDDFELTSDILFYVFLPILLFESAYSIRYKELLRNIRSISALAVASLIISAFVIAFLLQYVLGWLGLQIPFIVALLFGSLISSTDTAAALSIFKELGVPRRLNLIFEGESLFNDGTAIALFLVVLGVMESQATGGTITIHHNLYESMMIPFETYLGEFFPFLNGVLSLVSMIVFGILIGALVGIIFSKVIQKIRNDTYLEITLSLALAHAAFLVAEVTNHYFLPVSGIIATVAAAMVLGNYGRYKISPKVEEVMEKYWGFFAFISNSLVFVLVGMMLINLNVNWRPMVPLMLATVPIVIIARALSVYSVFGFLNFLKKEERVPRSWQHVLSWGALRGGLAVMMVLLIPSDIMIPGWGDPNLAIRDVLLSLTLGVVLFSIFVKTLTIAPLIRRQNIDALNEIEEFGKLEARIMMIAAVREKIRKIRIAGYVNVDVVNALEKKYAGQMKDIVRDVELLEKKYADRFGSLVRRIITLHALSIEKYWLRHLYKTNEIPEVVFKNIMKRILLQIRRVERGESQIEKVKAARPKEDFFERITEYVIDRLEPRIDPIKEQYLEIRTLHIIIEKALEGIMELGKIDFVFQQKEYMETVELYESFRSKAEQERRSLFRANREFLGKLSMSLTQKSLLATEESVLHELTEKEILSPKLALHFERMLEERC